MGLEALRGRLIVSVQVPDTSVLNEPETIALLARCAERNGAAAVRIEGLGRIAATATAVTIEVVGLIKRLERGFDVYITPTVADAEAVAAAGARYVAFDATARPRPDGSSLADIVAAIHRTGALALADCATVADGMQAAAAGADVVASTLCGYTAETIGVPLPALALVQELRHTRRLVVCEGGIGSPDAAAAAFAAGADAICVGTAITNVDVLVSRFVASTPVAKASRAQA